MGLATALLLLAIAPARGAGPRSVRATAPAELPALAAPAAPLDPQALSDAALIAPAAAKLEESYIEPVDRATLYESALSGLAAAAGRAGRGDAGAYVAALREEAQAASGPAGLRAEILFDGSVLVRGVDEGLAAGRAGLRTGDRIVGLGGGAPLSTLPNARTKETLQGVLRRGGELVVEREGALHRLRAAGHETAVTSLFARALLCLGGDNQREAAQAALRGLTAALDPYTIVVPARAASRFDRQLEGERGELAFGRLHGGDAGYVHLSRFGKGSAARVADIVEALLRRGARRLILDLRFNPGGLEPEMRAIASFFLPPGSVLYRSEYRGEAARVERTGAERPRFAGLPLRILLDGGSASASEILAGALREHGAAGLYGQASRGKGTGQDVYRLPAGAYLKATVGRWRLPSGRLLTFGDGLRPDVPLAAAGDADALKASLRARLAGDASAAMVHDPVLERALRER